MKHDFQEPQGVNFRCKDPISIEEFSPSLCKVISFLQEDAPHLGLIRYDDWWQHDGLHFPRGETEFHSLFQIAGTPRFLHEAMPGDHEVRIGVAPDTFRWYLRIFVDWDADDARLEGDFDLTLPVELTDQFRTEIIPHLPCTLVEDSSDTYYRSIKE